MRALLLDKIVSLTENTSPLRRVNWPVPEPAADEVLIRVHACGVCHTELDEIEGRAPPPRLPVIPGHQAVGRIAALGSKAAGLRIGDRVGVAWIYSACGVCGYCRRGMENLCAEFQATGRDAHGGYAEYMTARADFVHLLPDEFSDVQAAPLLCAGAVGYRALRLAGLTDGQDLGFTGFGASAHLVLQLARRQYPNSRFYVFARSVQERAYARDLGAVWAGDITDTCPCLLQAIIDTTPAWTPVLMALNNLAPGGRLIINAIRKEEADKDALLRLNYAQHLWREKEIKSVANVTRDDVRQFLRLAKDAGIRPEVEEYPLAGANRALLDMKHKPARGARVLRMI